MNVNYIARIKFMELPRNISCARLCLRHMSQSAMTSAASLSTISGTILEMPHAEF